MQYTIFAFPPCNARMGNPEAYLLAISASGQVLEVTPKERSVVSALWMTNADDPVALLNQQPFAISGWDMESYPIQRLLGSTPSDPVKKFDPNNFKPEQPVDAGMGNWGKVVGAFELAFE